MKKKRMVTWLIERHLLIKMNCLNMGNLLPMVLRKASFTDL